MSQIQSQQILDSILYEHVTGFSSGGKKGLIKKDKNESAIH